MPIAAVNVFGYTTPQWSQVVAVMGLVGAGVTLALGPVAFYGPTLWGAGTDPSLTVSIDAWEPYLDAA